MKQIEFNLILIGIGFVGCVLTAQAGSLSTSQETLIKEQTLLITKNHAETMKILKSKLRIDHEFLEELKEKTEEDFIESVTLANAKIDKIKR